MADAARVTYDALGVDEEQVLVVAGLHAREDVLAGRALRLSDQEVAVLSMTVQQFVVSE